MRSGLRPLRNPATPENCRSQLRTRKRTHKRSFNLDREQYIPVCRLRKIGKTVQGGPIRESISKETSVRVWKMGAVVKQHCGFVAAFALALISGCQCCPVFDRYANVIDDLNDKHVYFDHFYNPKCDISRMGRPDWNSPLHSRLYQRCCNNGCYDRYDECHVYPPQYPYVFPSNVMPAPTVRRSRISRPVETDDDLPSVLSPVPAAAPSPSPAQ